MSISAAQRRLPRNPIPAVPAISKTRRKWQDFVWKRFPKLSGVLYPKLSPIKHWIMIMQENRTFDMYFNGYPGANSNYSGGVAITNQGDGGGNHDQLQAAKAWSNGAMTPANFLSNTRNAMNYYPSTVPGISDYWTLASEFTLMDNFFSSWMGPSLTAHIVNLSANHGPCTDTKAAPNGYVENNIVPTKGSITATNILDLLTARNISFRYYGALGSTINLWAVPILYKTFPTYQQNVVPNTNIMTDIKLPEKEFPEVVWVIPPGYEKNPIAPQCVSEHPLCGPALGYQNWTGPIISGIMANKQLWYTSAILLCYDDWGGYYDHVPPPGVPAVIKPPPEQVAASGDPNTYYYGFRSPALMISPYAKRGFVDHTTYDFTSFLRTLEIHYGLPSLGGLDSVANDFLTYSPFDFRQAPPEPESLASFRPDLAAKTLPHLEPGEYGFAASPHGEEIENR